MRSVCVAAALLFPAVAAVHAIVLVSLHIDGKAPPVTNALDLCLTVHPIGAVDLDIYGAFQLCTIGILAAPVTVLKSKTYFFDPARNTIFIWTSLVLAGKTSGRNE
jgi:hypothetical protein